MKALIVVDMQNDFMPGGALGVPDGFKIIPIINELMKKFPIVVVTQDWHPHDHVSFITSHPGKKIGDTVIVNGIPQIVWPVHCVRNTKGAELVEGLNKAPIESNFYKGTDKMIDSYSAFFDNARRKSTGLADYLQSRKINDISIVGVATDYCVLYSTIDALDLGFTVTVIEDGCKGINLSPNDVRDALSTMREKGAKIVTSNSIN